MCRSSRCRYISLYNSQDSICYISIELSEVFLGIYQAHSGLTIHAVCGFLWSDKPFTSEKKLAKPRVWITVICLLLFQEKWCSVRQAGSLVHDSITQEFFVKTIIILQFAAEVLCAYLPFCHLEFSFKVLKHWDLIKIIFIASSRASLRQTGLFCFVLLQVRGVKNTITRTAVATALICAKSPHFYPPLILHHQCKCQQ